MARKENETSHVIACGRMHEDAGREVGALVQHIYTPPKAEKRGRSLCW